MKSKRVKYFIISSVLLSLFTLIFWEFVTYTENYIWSDVGIDSTKAIEEACKNIFWLKFPYWLLTINMSLLVIYLFSQKKVLIASVILLTTFISYFIFYPIIQRHSAKEYYLIFENQYVAEPYIEEPLLNAGYDVGEFVLPHIKDKDYNCRRYAIDALGKLKYYPAIKTLEEILFNENEEFYIRGDSFEALEEIHTNETKIIIKNFQKYLENSSDKKLKDYIKILKRV